MPVCLSSTSDVTKPVYAGRHDPKEDCNLSQSGAVLPSSGFISLFDIFRPYAVPTSLKSTPVARPFVQSQETYQWLLCEFPAGGAAETDSDRCAGEAGFLELDDIVIGFLAVAFVVEFDQAGDSLHGRFPHGLANRFADEILPPFSLMALLIASIITFAES